MKKNLACFSGFFVSLIPCGAFISVLVYIAYVSNSLVQGALYGFVFGAGNLFNPLIIISIAAPSISKRFEKIITKEQLYKIAASFVFLFWSGSLFWKAIYL